jgi:hypothetical protein
MNYHKPGIIPFSSYPKNTTLLWSGTDTLDNWRKNPDPRPWESVNISYQYNAQGFRTHDLEQYIGQNVDVTLGCSFTEGIGMPVESIWPTLVENQMQVPLLNLGLGSGSTDTVARILINIVTLYKIRNLYVLWPVYNRFELYGPNYVQHKLPMLDEIEFTWALDEFPSLNRYAKNKLIVEFLCEKYQIRLIEQQLTDYFSPDKFDCARDGMHFGFNSHRFVADNFLAKFI